MKRTAIFAVLGLLLLSQVGAAGWEDTKTGRGTAWAVDRDGHWVTAKHVTYGCDRGIYIEKAATLPRNAFYAEDKSTGKGFPLAAGWRYGEHEKADISLITSETSAKFLPLAGGRRFEEQLGKPAFAIGFPDGKPGEAYLLPHGTKHWDGKEFGIDGEVWAWSVEKMNPSGVALNGMSGGPVLDADGRVIGIIQAYNAKNKLLFTVPPDFVAGFIAGYAAPKKGAMKVKIDVNNFTTVADDLRKSKIITRVYCLNRQ